MIKYHHLVASARLFVNVATITRIPFLTEHIDPFWPVRRDQTGRVPEQLERVRIFCMLPRSEGRWPERIKKSVTI